MSNQKHSEQYDAAKAAFATRVKELYRAHTEAAFKERVHNLIGQGQSESAILDVVAAEFCGRIEYLNEKAWNAFLARHSDPGDRPVPLSIDNHPIDKLFAPGSAP